jgi:glucosamine-6-phosphate deaminase
MVRVHVEPAADWAATVSSALHSWLGARAQPRLGLAVGTTVEPVYQRVAPVLLNDATIFLLGEYGGMATGHPGRWATLMRRGPLGRVHSPDLRFRWPDVDAGDLDKECERYDEVIADGGLDLVVLGLGPNGHVGLNEPGSTADATTRVVQLTPTSQQASRQYGIADPPTWAITVGLGTVLAAREIWLVVTGRRKRTILDRVLHGPVGPDIPASLLRTHGNVTCWADDDALPRRHAHR